MLTQSDIHLIDVLEGFRKLPDSSIDCIVTSPPYNKLGLMKGKKQKGGDWDGYITYSNFDDNMTEEQYQQWQIDILNEMQRVIKPTGSIFYNHKNRRYNKTEYSPNEWVVRSNLNLYQTIIWNRKADVNNSQYFFQPVYELVYWMNKSNKKTPKFYKKRLSEQKSIWNISPKANLPHPAPFPEELVEQCILATTDVGDIVLDPFMGIGTTAVVADRLSRKYIGFEISQEYIDIAKGNLQEGKIRKKNQL
jgi:site-specific DNA-methyltransferase (adenine-specific)